MGNTATGHDANNDDPSKCSAMNNGQNEIGSGGNGGAVYSDGNSVNITLCGDAILDNSAGSNAFGGGLFFTSDDMMGTLSITDYDDDREHGRALDERFDGQRHERRHGRRRERKEHHRDELDPPGLPLS